MIFVKLLLSLLVFVDVDSDEQSNEYIMVATNWQGKADFYQVSMNLSDSTLLANLPGYGSKSPDKLYLGSNATYGQFKNLDLITRFRWDRYRFVNTTEGAKDMLFVGPDSEDNLYFYSPKSKTFSVYKFDEPTKIQKDLKGLESEDKLVVIGRDQCNKDWVYLLRCSSTQNSAFIFDLKKDSIVFEYPNIKPPECFDFWGVSPNGEKIYFLDSAERNNIKIHEIAGHNQSRQIHKEYIRPTCFAAGNKELFYAFGNPGFVAKFVENGKRKNSHLINVEYVPGASEASAIAVHQPTEECWNPKPTS